MYYLTFVIITLICKAISTLWCISACMRLLCMYVTAVHVNICVGVRADVRADVRMLMEVVLFCHCL